MRILTLISIVFLAWVQPLFAGDIVYIDVRSEKAYARGHIEDALLMPYKEIATLIEKSNIAKDSEIVLYCGSGGLAGKALKTLQDMGYSNVTNAGGYKDLAQKLTGK